MSTEPKRLYRSRSNRFIGGVCAGLGEFFGIDPTIIRLLFILLAILGWVAPAVVLYVVMMFVVPEDTSGMLPAASGETTGPDQAKVTSQGEAVPTGAGGRSQQPAPEPSAQDDIVHGPVGTPAEEVYREPQDPSTSFPDEPRD